MQKFVEWKSSVSGNQANLNKKKIDVLTSSIAQSVSASVKRITDMTQLAY